MTHPLRLQQLVKLVDLTRLNEEDSSDAVQLWLQQQLPVQTSVWPAAVCVYPAYIGAVKAVLSEREAPCQIATVVNFPSGTLSLETVEQEIASALEAGADEIDCVLPYQRFMAGDVAFVREFLIKVRTACKDKALKIIIESGELSTAQQISKATELCIECGADFVKTSTGKVAVGVTEEAARLMLTSIAASEKAVGFKASGGVRSIEFAEKLLQLTEEILGQVATSNVLRIGASGLLQDITKELDY